MRIIGFFISSLYKSTVSRPFSTPLKPCLHETRISGVLDYLGSPAVSSLLLKCLSLRQGNRQLLSFSPQRCHSPAIQQYMRALNQKSFSNLLKILVSLAPSRLFAL